MPDDDYFTQMGKFLVSQMADEPKTRAYADVALRHHLAGAGMAYDAMPLALRRTARDEDPEAELEPRGRSDETEYNDQEEEEMAVGGQTVSNAAEIAAWLKSVAAQLSPDERTALLQSLADMLDQDAIGENGDTHAIAGIDGSGGGIYGVTTRGVRDNNGGARDRRVRGAMDRQFQARAAASQSFAQRFPFVAGVEMWDGEGQRQRRR